jgi:hypothetical protein
VPAAKSIDFADIQSETWESERQKWARQKAKAVRSNPKGGSSVSLSNPFWSKIPVAGRVVSHDFAAADFEPKSGFSTKVRGPPQVRDTVRLGQYAAQLRSLSVFVSLLSWNFLTSAGN